MMVRDCIKSSASFKSESWIGVCGSTEPGSVIDTWSSPMDTDLDSSELLSRCESGSSMTGRVPFDSEFTNGMVASGSLVGSSMTGESDGVNPSVFRQCDLPRI